MSDLVCLNCDTINEQEFYRDGVCGECQTVAGAVTPCPLGDGGLDCSPFCPECGGNQFIGDDTATPLSDTDKHILELCETLHNLAGYTATLVRDECEIWVSAVYEAITLLQTHAGDTDLSGME
jgi:hypothetical protein